MATAKKAPAKKAPAKKAPAKKAAAKKAAAAPAAAKKAAAPKAIADTMNKTELARHIAEQSGVELKDVKAVLQSLEDTMVGSLRKRGAGQFTLPGVVKVTTQRVAARPRRKGINPFTGEETVFAAKPASTRVKVRALKKLKDATQS